MTVLIDTSAWIEYFCRTGSVRAGAVREFAETGNTFKTCGPVSMEVLAGAANPTDLDTMRDILELGTDIPLDMQHFEEAAALYRLCREAGFTIRSLMDCLIAVVAMSQEAEILHHDRDFNTIARVVPLRVHASSLTT